MIIYPITIPGGSDTQFQYNNGGLFGGTAYLTLNDATGVTTATGLTVTGNSVLGLNSAVFQPTADSTTFFQVLDADGGVPILNVDSINERVGYGIAPNEIGTLQLVTQTNSDGFYFRRHAGDSGDNIGLYFKTSADTSTGYYKGAIIWEDGGISGARGNLHLVSDATNDSGNATISDLARVKIGGSSVTTYHGAAGSFTVNTIHDTLVVSQSFVQMVSQNAGFPVQLDAYSSVGSPTAGILGRAARGTIAAPTATQASDLLFAAGGIGYTGSAFETESPGLFTIRAHENHSATNHGTSMSFSTTPDGSTHSARLLRLYIGDDGNIGIGNESDPETHLEMTGTAPYITLHNNTHEDTAGGRESRLNFKGEKSGGEEGTLAMVEVSHDGAADDYGGKYVISTHTKAEAGADTLVTALTIDSAQNTKIGDGGTTNYTNIAADGTITQKGTARIDWTKITAASITKGAGTHSGTTGDTTGFVADLDTAHDGNYYHIDEVAAGFDVIVHFTSVTAFNWVQALCNYKGTVSHGVVVQVYNWSTTVYDSYKTVPCAINEFGAGINIIGDCGFFVPDDTNYIGTGGDAGKVNVRILHSSSGNAAHDFDADCIALYQ